VFFNKEKMKKSLQKISDVTKRSLFENIDYVVEEFEVDKTLAPTISAL